MATPSGNYGQDNTIQAGRGYLEISAVIHGCEIRGLWTKHGAIGLYSESIDLVNAIG